MPPLTRREALALGAAAATAAALPRVASAQSVAMTPPVRYCLNTSTVRGAKLDLPALVALASQAGYDGIEPWLGEIAAYRDAGGSLPDLRNRIADAGLTVESAIGFAEWIVDDPARRRAGLEAARRDMDLVAAIGGGRIAAPPAGATKERLADLPAIAGRYADLCRVGAEAGVVPQLEVWGFSQTLARLGETLYVLAECGRPEACLLPDVYHVYKGGSPLVGLGVVAGPAIHVLHMNDYPADPPRETIADAARVYPGDGVAPLDGLLAILFGNGFRGVLSLELFNPDYWQRPPAEVAQLGLAKMRTAVARAAAASVPASPTG